MATEKTPNAEEVAAYEEAMAASRSVVTSVQHGGLLQKPVDAAANEIDQKDVVSVLVTKPFTLNTDDGKRIHFPIGVRRCPKALLDHWYVKAHGVQTYDARGPSAEIINAIVVPPDMPHEVEIGDEKVPLTVITLSTVRDLRISPDVWNALPDGDKRKLIQDKIRVSQDYARSEAAEGAGAPEDKGKGKPARK